MNQLPFHKSPLSPPANLPIIERLISTYKLWHSFQSHIPKIPRYSLGIKIDRLLIETVEMIFDALQRRDNKLSTLILASRKLETAKFLLQITWGIQALDDEKYISLSEGLNEIGRQLGGWLRKTEKENSTR